MIKSQLEKGIEPRNFKKSLERIANTFKLFHTKLLNDYKDPALSNKYRIDAHFLENLTTNIEDIEKLQKNFPSRKRKVVSKDSGQRPAAVKKLVAKILLLKKDPYHQVNRKEAVKAHTLSR